MKKLLTMMLIPVAIVYFFAGCQGSNKKGQVSDYEKEQAEKEANLKTASDSIVSLSFGGLILGQPISSMINKAVKDRKIWDIKQNRGDNIVRFKSNIFLPEQESPLCVDIVVTSFQDSIARICLVSEDYTTYQQLIDLYTSRYNDKYASSLQWSNIWGNNEFFLHKDVDLWDRNASHDGRSWLFNNQSLHVVHEYTTEEQVYLKDSRMKSPENRYGTTRTNYFKRVIILYNDNELCKKVEEYLKSVEIQSKADEQRKLEIARGNQIDRVSNQDI